MALNATHVHQMSAAEIIEKIKALPPEEQRQVIAFFRAAEQAKSLETKTPRYADDGAAKAAGDRVLEEHAEVFKRLAE